MTNMSDRKEISKSAPANGRRQSTGDQKKSSTAKEINGWIYKGNNDQMKRTGARNVSQLTENVTEERMLYARQLELGRERYKFLVSHEYEKQKFMERQQSKEKMMKKYMSSARRIIDKAYAEKPKKTLTIRIPQVEYSSQSSTPVGDEHGQRTDSRSSRISAKSSIRVDSIVPRLESRASTRFIMTPENNRSTKKCTTTNPRKASDSKRAKEITFVDYSRPDSRVRQCTTQPNKPQRTQSSVQGAYVNTSLNSSDGFETEKNDRNRLPSVTGSKPCCNRRNFSQERGSSRLSRSKSTTSMKQNKNNSINNTLGGRAKSSITTTSTVTPKWEQKREYKFGEKFGSSITDPRYVALASTLSPINVPDKPGAKVKDIIAKNYVLRTSSKCESAVNAKVMHAKFIALLLRNELSAE